MSDLAESSPGPSRSHETDPVGADSSGPATGRPLSARSIIASTLLGIHPPRLPGRILVRSGELFGISEGATRTAMSRMVATGELIADDGAYELSGHLLDRQARQDASRHPRLLGGWKGQWELAVVVGERRSAAARAELRRAASHLRLAEMREGVWGRPANLAPGREPSAREVVAAQCATFDARPDDPGSLVGRMWDLERWAIEADSLRAALVGLLRDLEAGESGGLAEGFVVSAAVLRHLLADPLLPPALLPPLWPADALRTEYDRFDAAFKAVWRDWFRQQAAER